jgi:single-stranded-DNA-specific exonuclease
MAQGEDDAARVRVRGPARLREEDLRRDAARLQIDPLVLQLLHARGIEGDDALVRATAPKLRDLRPPSEMAGFPAALELLEWVVLRGRVRVGVFGDYDVDGVSTAAILAGWLESLGLTVVVRVAHRDSGYGLTIADADAFASAGVELVLTGDTGTSDVESLARLRERGIKTVVIDHHQVPETMPPTDALINPHQAGCGFPFKGLCSAGVAFYLCAALRSRLAGRASVSDPREWLDLVALATVCDMMPLVDENRVLVKAGLERLTKSPRPGLKALLERAGVGADEVVTEEHIGFRLGPRLNAPGRLGAAEPALRLLRARTAAEAQPLAEHVEALNVQRKLASERCVAEALVLVETDRDHGARGALVVAHEGWKAGIVGLAASTLAEHHGKPAMVLAIDPATGVARGSIRSARGIDVRAALVACRDLLLRYGGHREAAGVSVEVTQLGALAEAFAAACAEQPGSPGADATEIDGELPLARLDEGLVRRIQSLAPYGTGFPAPRWLGRGVVESVRVHKDRHVGLRLRQDGVLVDAIAFDHARQVPALGESLVFLFAPSLDAFRGETRVRAVIERMWSPRPP